MGHTGAQRALWQAHMQGFEGGGDRTDVGEHKDTNTAEQNRCTDRRFTRALKKEATAGLKAAETCRGCSASKAYICGANLGTRAKRQRWHMLRISVAQRRDKWSTFPVHKVNVSNGRGMEKDIKSTELIQSVSKVQKVSSTFEPLYH